MRISWHLIIRVGAYTYIGVHEGRRRLLESYWYRRIPNGREAGHPGRLYVDGSQHTHSSVPSSDRVRIRQCASRAPYKPCIPLTKDIILALY